MINKTISQKCRVDLTTWAESILFWEMWSSELIFFLLKVFLSYHWMAYSCIWFLKRNYFFEHMPAWDTTVAGYQVLAFLAKTGSPCRTAGTTSSDSLSSDKSNAPLTSASTVQRNRFFLCNRIIFAEFMWCPSWTWLQFVGPCDGSIVCDGNIVFISGYVNKITNKKHNISVTKAYDKIAVSYLDGSVDHI